MSPRGAGQKDTALAKRSRLAFLGGLRRSFASVYRDPIMRRRRVTTRARDGHHQLAGDDPEIRATDIRRQSSTLELELQHIAEAARKGLDSPKRQFVKNP
jgi:hypothetical protein